MKNLFISLAVVGLSIGVSAKENSTPAAVEVNSACSQDAATAGCGGEKVGTGLLKCLHAYKKEHKEFKMSESCKSAKKSLKEQRKSHKKEA